ncbi:MAG: hypothetical protein EXQ59_06445 [Acidobacteria bacterium]|nr:hypothetical protein [Acidobacteriota bacterium]
MPQISAADPESVGDCCDRLRLDSGRTLAAIFGLLGNDDEIRLTPLETAVMSGELEIVRLLDAKGARRDAALTAHLLALATARGADDITDYLSGVD